MMGERGRDVALVLGGSMAGLLAAKTLSETFSEVLVVDRDELSGVRGPRRGVPHGRHAHGLLARGQQILQNEFPGLTEELIEAGVETGDFNGDIRWILNGQRLRPAHAGLACVPATRPVLEYHIRKRVEALPNVSFRERRDIVGLVASSDGRRVTGARVHGDSAETLSADLVIDATGRASRTPVWLEELGYERPPEEKVKIGLAYTTRHFQLKSDPFGGDLAIIPVATPSHPRGAFFYKLPGGGGRIELSLTGILGDYPPTDPDGFLEFTRTLPVPDIYQAVCDAEPLDEAVSFRFPASVRRRYERMARFPEGLLVMGDAASSFNPVYGQGMTTAALEMLTLRRHLEQDGLPRPRRFFNDIARDINAPWDFSSGADLGYPEVEGRRTPKIRMANAYIARLHAAAVHDSALTTAFIRAAGLIDTPQALMRPSVMLRVARNMWRPAGAAPSSASREAVTK
ncbi:NAD(P)/FAD-dependent oxidoreductase [Actinomadura sp. 1N219]|uniref:NAD(P)/FAD-dependent oxidoreductase n=1 Tax=Actinomadura sp. 1N219 TaxID=3375152 RepID=UPI00379F73B3